MRKVIFCLIFTAFLWALMPASNVFQYMMDIAEPAVGYDKVIVLEEGQEYYGGLIMFDSYYSEDFEGQQFPPEGWSQYSLEANTSWHHAIRDGNTTWYAAHYHSDELSDDWLVTPSLYIEEGADLLLHYARGWATGCVNALMVSTEGPDPGIHNFQNLTSFYNLPMGFVHDIIDLQAYEGQEVYLAFRYRGSAGNDFHIDGFRLGQKLTDAKVKIVGNGAMVNLERYNIMVWDNNTLDIDRTVLYNGSYAFEFRNYASARITNCLMMYNNTGIFDASFGEILCTNSIITGNYGFGVYRPEETFNNLYLEYNLVSNNGTDGQQNYIYHGLG